jgi:hypothetical protein
MTSRGRKVALGLGLLAGVLLILAWVVHYQAKWAVERYKRQLIAAGEKLEVKQLVPPLPLPESNGAPILTRAVGVWARNFDPQESNTPVAMRLIAPGKAIAGWALPGVGQEGTNPWSHAEAALAQDSATMDLVREAAGRGVLDFQLDYRQGYSLLLPHLAPLKRAVQLLETAAMCDLHDKDAAEAAADIGTMLALVRATANERLPISQLVRIAMANVSMAATWELVQYPDLTEQQLAAVQRAWTGLSFIQPAEDALAMERAVGEMSLERMRNSSAEFRQLVAGSAPPPSFSFWQAGDNLVMGVREARWRLSQSYPDELRALRGHQVLLETFRHVRGGQPFAMAISEQEARLATLQLVRTNDDSGRRWDPSGPDLRSLFSESVLSLSRMLNRVLVAEAGRELSVTALALKRYQLVRHGYPAELSALVPQFLPRAPRDPADGNPLRYRLRPDGSFLLYSVGEDGIDNGGNASSEVPSKSVTWQRGRDLVWPRPASPEELKAFLEKHSKKPEG